MSNLHFTYVSFKKTPPETILKQLYRTNLVNRLMKSEKLFYTSVTDKVFNKKTNKTLTLTNMLMSIVNQTGRKLFIGVAQGNPNGSYHDASFVIFHPLMKKQVHKWLVEIWGTTCTIKNKPDGYLTHSVPPLPEGDKEYEDFIKKSTYEITFTPEEEKINKYSTFSKSSRDSTSTGVKGSNKEKEKNTTKSDQQKINQKQNIQQSELIVENKELTKQVQALTESVTTLSNLVASLLNRSRGQHGPLGNVDFQVSARNSLHKIVQKTSQLKSEVNNSEQKPKKKPKLQGKIHSHDNDEPQNVLLVEDNDSFIPVRRNKKPSV